MNSLAAMSSAHGTSSLSAAARLAPETLAQIFMHVDPHTLYTSVRSLSRSWKQCVEDRILVDEFASGQWRVGLRVVRKPKTGKTWQGGVAGRQGIEGPAARWHDAAAQLKSNLQGASEEEQHSSMQRLREQYVDHILSRPGALEDELSPLDHGCRQASLEPLVHVVPLQFQGYDADSTSLCFATCDADWHALFEHNHGDRSVDANTGRLDLDFGIVWRFPGDGQDEDGWGIPDQENGWLSRFYCSSFDVKDSGARKEIVGEQRLTSTPLARRIRRAVSIQPDSLINDPSNPQEQRTSTSWADDGHEYASLSLSLGTEFFVRRSARANYLLRRLEAAARADQEEQAQEAESVRVSAAEGMASTPRRNPMKLPDHVRNLTSSATSSSVPSGASTPLPPWSRGGRSFAEIASTPPSASPFGKARAMQSGTSTPLSGVSRRPLSKTSSLSPQVRRLTGHLAPNPSTAASGYNSVHHQSPVDSKDVQERKRQEAADRCQAREDAEEDEEDDAALSSTPSTTSTPSKPGSRHDQCSSSKAAGSSGQLSVPRAHFCARLMQPCSKDEHGAMVSSQWTGGDAWGRGASATATACVTTGIWEWTR